MDRLEIASTVISLNRDDYDFSSNEVLNRVVNLII